MASSYKRKKKIVATKMDFYSREEKKDIILALRAAAQSMAELWDTLRIAEHNHSVDLNVADRLVAELAGELNLPPDAFDKSQLSDEMVFKSYLNNTKVSR